MYVALMLVVLLAGVVGCQRVVQQVVCAVHLHRVEQRRADMSVLQCVGLDQSR